MHAAYVRAVNLARLYRLLVYMYVHQFLLVQILFLFHKKKKNLYWDIDTLIHWKHVR